MKNKTLYWNHLEDKKRIAPIKQMKFIENNIYYTNVNILKKFVTKFGKIKSKRKTFFTAKLQRLIAKTIKKSRNSALIPTKSSVLFN